MSRGDGIRATAALEIEDARSFLAQAERLTDVSTDYRKAALLTRFAQTRFESAAKLMSDAEDADQDDHNRSVSHDLRDDLHRPGRP